MSSPFATLNDGADGSGEKSARRRKIDRSQWPELLARRDAGASQAQIAQEYGVSQGTISQILKRARAERESGTLGTPEAEASAADESQDTGSDATSAPAAAAEAGPETASDAEAGGDADAAQEPAVNDERAQPRPAAHGSSRMTTTRLTTRATRSTSESTAPAASSEAPAGEAARPPASASERPQASAAKYDNPLAQRLREAAERCADMVERGGAGEETLGDAVHEVRRALAAVEIETAKRNSPARHSSRPPAEPGMPQPQSARSYAAEPPRAEPSRAELPRAEPMRSEPRPEPGYGDTRAPGMHTGRIKFFKPDKGFGFIIPDGGGEDVFLGKDTVAAAGLDRLSQGDRVAYEPGPGNKGIEAKSIRLAS